MVKVPDEAEQALIFLAPATGGDFSTLRSTVRGKPGAFVRAAQDLVQASLDRARLEQYLTLVREAWPEDAAALQRKTNRWPAAWVSRLINRASRSPRRNNYNASPKTAVSLYLTTHTESMVATLTSGTSVDLLTQIPNTPHMPGSAYDPYVGAVVDVVRILGSAHTAKYQYVRRWPYPNAIRSI